MIPPKTRAFFGYKHKTKKTIREKPGIKHGFKLSHYYDKHDSDITVSNILQQIQDHVENLHLLDIYNNGSTLKKYYTKKLKEKLRKSYLERDTERRVSTFVVGDETDRIYGFPQQYCIRSILMRYAGQHIRIVAYNGTPTEFVRSVGDIREGDLININTSVMEVVTRAVTLSDGNKGKTLIGDREYIVPSTRSAISKVFKEKIFYEWDAHLGSSYHTPLLDTGDTIKVFVIQKVRPQKPSQNFAQGISHCLIQPLINDMNVKKQIQGQSKQQKSNYNCAIKKLEEYKQRYSTGIPENVLSEMVEYVSKSCKINISINLPCSSSQYMVVRNQYGKGIHYHFTNTQIDHVDYNQLTLRDVKSQGKDKSFSEINVTQDEMNAILKDHWNNNCHCEWMQNGMGVCKLWSGTQIWRVNAENNDAMSQFQLELEFHRLKIDHNKDKCSQFIRDGTHFCCSASFQTLESSVDRETLKCYDIIKSYATFNECRFYDECKFPNKITHFQPTNSIKGPGLYYVDEIDFSTANVKFVEVNRRMGHPIQAKNIYVVPILKLLDEMNVKYKITLGCWAGGRVNTFDFRFSNNILDKKLYAMLVGKWHQLCEENVYYCRGSQEMASNIMYHSPNAIATWREKVNDHEPPEGIICIQYPAKHRFHLSQFAAYINGYEYVKMVDQLMLCDLSKVIQIQKDDFICIPHDFKLLQYFKDKTPELYSRNEKGTLKLDNKLFPKDARQYLFKNDNILLNDELMLNYFSNIGDFSLLAHRHISKCRAHLLRFQHIKPVNDVPVVVHEGPGSTGKTDYALLDPSRVECCYVAPSWKLATAKSKEYNLSTSGDDALEKFERSLEGVKKGDRKTLVPIEIDSLDVTVKNRLLNKNAEIWKKIDQHCNTIIIDEVSMMWNEEATLIMERFPNHAIVFCGDPGFQLDPYRTQADSDKSPFRSYELNLPVIRFDKIFGVSDDLINVRMGGRQLLANGASIEECEAYYKSKCKVLSTRQEVIDMYEPYDANLKPKDFFICATIKLCDEWTELLKIGQSYQKYQVKSCSQDLNNGEIVISKDPPRGVQSELRHAFTAHSTIGERAPGKLFIDRRSMFELTHWETIIGRAKKLENIYIIDISDNDIDSRYENCIIYKISTEIGNMNYIGHTIQSLEDRVTQHKSDKCMSNQIFQYDDWKSEVVESYPCSNKKAAEARERWWFQQTPNCVNKHMVGKGNGPYIEVRKEYFNNDNLDLVVSKLQNMELVKSTKLRSDMTTEERMNDNLCIFKAYVMKLASTKLEDENGNYFQVTYTRKNCGGRRYSMGDVPDEMGSSKKISYSLQGMYGCLRIFLLSDRCHDVDIVNCIPTILIQIAEKDNVPIRFRETLAYYIMHRQECLDEIIVHHFVSEEELATLRRTDSPEAKEKLEFLKGCAKEAVIRIYNGGSFKKWAEDVQVTNNRTNPAPFLVDLENEMAGMVDYMLSLPKYAAIRKACKKLKRDQNGRLDQAASDRSAFATICFAMEDRILQEIEKSFRRNGWKSETLIYDGLPVFHRKRASLADAMRKAEADVLKRTEFHIQLAEKPMFGVEMSVDDLLSVIAKK